MQSGSDWCKKPPVNLPSFTEKKAARLLEIHAYDDRVSVMVYEVGAMSWAIFLNSFVNEILRERSEGFIRLIVIPKNDRIFSWIFRKRDIYLIGLVDGDDSDADVFELGQDGDGEIRYLGGGALLTGYANSYKAMLISTLGIVGTTLSLDIFEKAQVNVSQHAGEPETWRTSFGITALTISESARFIPLRDVVIERFDNGGVMYLGDEGEGDYDWVAFMANNWLKFTNCARRFIYPEPVLYDPKTIYGAYECLRNPTAATMVLLVKCII